MDCFLKVDIKTRISPFCFGLALLLSLHKEIVMLGFLNMN